MTVAELVSSGWTEAIQGAAVDIMLRLALAGRWTPESARRLQDSVSPHWTSDELLKPLLAAADGAAPASGSASSMPVLIASSLTTIANDEALSQGDRIRRDLYWLYQAAGSLGRRALEPLVVKSVAEGWRFVLEHQRFALSMPMRTAPSIEAAIVVLEQHGIRAAPRLMDAAADATRLSVPSQWRAFLAALGGV